MQSALGIPGDGRSRVSPRRCRRYTRKPFFAICGLCTLLVGLLHLLQFKPLLDAQLFAEDSLQRFFGRPAPVDPDLVFLAIDHPSTSLDQFAPEEIAASPALQLMKQELPWPRALYPLIIGRLIDSGAKVVVLDIVFSTPRDGDEEFRAALDNHRDQVVIGCNFTGGKRAAGENLALQLPAESLIEPTSPLDGRVGFVNFWPDEDDVIRHVYYRRTAAEVFGDMPASDEEILHSLAAKALEKSGHPEALPPGTEPQRIRFAGRANTFRARSACDLFDAKKWASPEYQNGAFFRGKTVILGAEGNFLNDLQLTPVGFMAGAELHLNAINAAMHQGFLYETSRNTVLWLIGGAGALALALCYIFHGPLLRLGLLAGAGAAWLVTAEMLYSDGGLFIPVVAPLIALSTGGVGCLGWDFFLEQRERARIRSVLDKYVAKNVVELVLAEGDAFANALQGQRRCVTTLFSDIRGFTSITEQAEPEELVAQLNEYFFGMVEAVLAEGGTLQQFIGDAILAVWGDTRTLERAESAFHAVRTSLLMQTTLETLNREWLDQPGRRQLAIGIGINQGDVVVGSLGHPLRMRFTVVGDGINTAARLETATKHYGCSVLVGQSVEEKTRTRFHYQLVDRVKFVGKAQAIEVFTPLCETSEAPPPWLVEYHRAVTLYRSRQFHEAAGVFRNLAEQSVGGALCRMYLSRCECFINIPPDPNWDGIHLMTEK